MNRSLCLLLAGSLLFSSCKVSWNWKHPLRFKRKQTITATPTLPEEAKPVELSKADKQRQDLVENLRNPAQSFRTLSARAKVATELNGSSISLTVAMRIKSDSIMWMSVSALGGLEVARVLITPDSIKIIDRFKGQYMVKGFDYMQSMLSPEVDFQLLQATLVGLAPAKYLTDSLVLAKDTAGLLLMGQQEQLKYQFRLYGKDKISRAYYEDQVYVQSFDAAFDNYQEVDGALFPFLVKILSNSGKDKLEATLTYTKIERNAELEFPFNPPGK